MIFFKNFKLVNELKRFLLKIVLFFFTPMRSAWVVLAYEYTNLLQGKIDSYIEILNVKIYIAQMLLKDNQDIVQIVYELEECKKNMEELKKQCILDTKNTKQIKILKESITKMHNEINKNKIYFNNVSQLYKKTITQIQNKSFFLCRMPKIEKLDPVIPSVSLDIENIRTANKFLNEPEQNRKEKSRH